MKFNSRLKENIRDLKENRGIRFYNDIRKNNINSLYLRNHDWIINYKVYSYELMRFFYPQRILSDEFYKLSDKKVVITNVDKWINFCYEFGILMNDEDKPTSKELYEFDIVLFNCSASSYKYSGTYDIVDECHISNLMFQDDFIKLFKLIYKFIYEKNKFKRFLLNLKIKLYV